MFFLKEGDSEEPCKTIHKPGKDFSSVGGSEGAVKDLLKRSCLWVRNVNCENSGPIDSNKNLHWSRDAVAVFGRW